MNRCLNRNNEKISHLLNNFAISYFLKKSRNKNQRKILSKRKIGWRPKHRLLFVVLILTILYHGQEFYRIFMT